MYEDRIRNPSMLAVSVLEWPCCLSTCPSQTRGCVHLQPGVAPLAPGPPGHHHLLAAWPPCHPALEASRTLTWPWLLSPHELFGHSSEYFKFLAAFLTLNLSQSWSKTKLSIPQTI